MQLTHLSIFLHLRVPGHQKRQVFLMHPLRSYKFVPEQLAIRPVRKNCNNALFSQEYVQVASPSWVAGNENQPPCLQKQQLMAKQSPNISSQSYSKAFLRYFLQNWPKLNDFWLFCGDAAIIAKFLLFIIWSVAAAYQCHRQMSYPPPPN